MFEIIAGLFAVESIWLWVYVTVIALSMSAFVEAENGLGASIFGFLSLFLGAWLFHVPVLNLLISDPKQLIGYVAIYALIGAFWSLIKWIFYLKKSLREYEVLKTSFLADNDAKELTPELAYKFTNSSKYNNNRFSQTPTAATHKQDIIRWMAYWPFSVLGTVFSDVLLRFWDLFYGLLHHMYDDMASMIFRGISKDIELAKSHVINEIQGKKTKTSRYDSGHSSIQEGN